MVVGWTIYVLYQSALPSVPLSATEALCARTGLSEQMERGHRRIETADRYRMQGSSDSCTCITENSNRKVVEDKVIIRVQVFWSNCVVSL